jgi:peptide deformylase
MAILHIIEVPDSKLREISKPVDAVTDDLRQLMDDMLDTMYAAPGVGLAAVQVGVPKRILVIDCADDDEKPNPLCFVNPVVTWASEELNEYKEGCLSVPEQYSLVTRPAQCHLEYLDYDGTPQKREFDGMLATVFQHEMDHLEGILFIDHISKIKKTMIIKKLTKAKKLAL